LNGKKKRHEGNGVYNFKKPRSRHLNDGRIKDNQTWGVQEGRLGKPRGEKWVLSIDKPTLTKVGGE